MKRLFALFLLMPILLACSNGTVNDEKQAVETMPLLDSLVNSAKPFNSLKIDDLRKNIAAEFKKIEGQRFYEIDGLDFKIDALLECENDTVFIALVNRSYKDEYSYIIRVTSHLPQNEALDLDETMKYRVKGILKSIPERFPFIDGIYAPEIDLGIFSVDSIMLLPAIGE